MTMFLLGRVLPDFKEGYVVKQEEAPQSATKNAIFNFYGVERGTEAARLHAAAEFARIREVTTDASDVGAVQAD